MFGIAWNEYVVIAVVALIVIGPKELPRVLRTIGQWTARVRHMAAEFQGQFQEALREAEMADLKKEVDNLHATASGIKTQFDDPMNFQAATKQEPRPEAGKPDDVAKLAAASPEPPPTREHEHPATEHPVTEAAGAVPASPAGEADGVKADGGVHA
jgi:sec-independent protein translocase protein TatB